jgi:glutathione S-transferase
MSSLVATKTIFLVGPIVGLLTLESAYLRQQFPRIYETSPLFSALPRGYGAVLIVNLVLSSITLFILGFRVGAARNRTKEKALKDGDHDAEARYSYPKMYAEGFSEHARIFNCIQRGHQHALETFPMFLALSLTGGVRFPVSATLGGLLWSYARLKWAEGYAEGDPAKRYSRYLSTGIWTGLFIQLFAALVTAVGVLGLI